MTPDLDDVAARRDDMRTAVFWIALAVLIGIGVNVLGAWVLG